MPQLPKPSVVVFVADVPRMTRFYATVAGMTHVSADATHAVLELEGLQLVIHALHGEPSVEPGHGGAVPVREDSYVKVCLPVASIAAARAAAAALGGALHPPDREWQVRGFRACDGHDPEGNVIQVRQTAT
jgi:predicted enzyme related to lactoylglutathione lyase